MTNNHHPNASYQTTFIISRQSNKLGKYIALAGVARIDKLEDFLSHFKGVTKRAGSVAFTALCPAHDDKEPSLSISISTNDPDRILTHCFAGCSFEAIKVAAGLSPRDFYLNEYRGER